MNTEKTKALRLASILDTCNWLTAPTDEEIAAELRRLHAENERLHQINQSHEMKLSVRGYEIQIADLEAQRDLLLEALQALYDEQQGPPLIRHQAAWEAAMEKARAAIKKAREA